jgi:hypothetical protein
MYDNGPERQQNLSLLEEWKESEDKEIEQP